jgi:hypothetical protein
MKWRRENAANETIPLLNHWLDHFVPPYVKRLHLCSCNHGEQNRNNVVRFLTLPAVSGTFSPFSWMWAFRLSCVSLKSWKWHFRRTVALFLRNASQNSAVVCVTGDTTAGHRGSVKKSFKNNNGQQFTLSTKSFFTPVTPSKWPWHTTCSHTSRSLDSKKVRNQCA